MCVVAVYILCALLVYIFGYSVFIFNTPPTSSSVCILLRAFSHITITSVVGVAAAASGGGGWLGCGGEDEMDESEVKSYGRIGL